MWNANKISYTTYHKRESENEIKETEKLFTIVEDQGKKGERKEPVMSLRIQFMHKEKRGEIDKTRIPLFPKNASFRKHKWYRKIEIFRDAENVWKKGMCALMQVCYFFEIVTGMRKMSWGKQKGTKCLQSDKVYMTVEIACYDELS